MPSCLPLTDSHLSCTCTLHQHMPRPLPPWLELIPSAASDHNNNTADRTTTEAAEPSQTANLLPFDTMSSASTPISPQIFAIAIKDLPVDTLYAKAAELLNSMEHLRQSNAQMKDFADEGDEVCKEAIVENDVVIERIGERVQLCKAEVEGRGMRWTGHVEAQGEDGQESKTNGVVANGDAEHEAGSAAPAPSGRLTDEELRRQLEAQMDDDEEDGVHL